MTAYRNDVDALAARHASLAGEVAAKTRERDDAARLLAEAQARARLPVLANIRIASPCTAAWSKMAGDDRVRHCGDCDKDVFNLSALTRDEAEALIAEQAGALCARYFQRNDGTILLADCEVGATRQRRRRRIVAAGAATLLASGGAAALLTRGSAGSMAPRTHEYATMGEATNEPPVELTGTIAPNPPVDQRALDLHLHEVKGGVSFRPHDPSPRAITPKAAQPARRR